MGVPEKYNGLEELMSSIEEDSLIMRLVFDGVVSEEEVRKFAETVARHAEQISMKAVYYLEEQGKRRMRGSDRNALNDGSHIQTCAKFTEDALRHIWFEDAR